jgi:hypothetical protein
VITADQFCVALTLEEVQLLVDFALPKALDAAGARRSAATPLAIAVVSVLDKMRDAARSKQSCK